MSIQPISAPAPRQVDPVSSDSAAVQPAARTAPPQASAAPVERAPAIPSDAELKDAVSNINKSLQSLSQGLEFSIDSDSNRTIVKVIDQATKEVIRQMPSPEALEIAKALDTVKGLLIRQTA